VRVHQLRIRKGSGGKGRHRGGDGLVKEVEFLADARVTVAGTRRQEGAPGAEGGDAGQAGRDSLLRKNQPSQRLSCGESVDLKKGDRIIIRSPGGGGWGPPNKKGN
jgi:N-methylhydantoinase B